MDPNDYIDTTALQTVQDDLRRMLTDLIKAGLVSTNEASVSRWREDAMMIHGGLRSRLALLTNHAVHLDALWVQARQEAQKDELVQAEENVKPIL